MEDLEEAYHQLTSHDINTYIHLQICFIGSKETSQLNHFERMIVKV